MENTGNATFNGSVTTNAGVVIDNITIDECLENRFIKW